MKKITIAVIVLGSISFTSCKKCADCHYDDANGNEVEIGEFCDDDLKNAEENGYQLNDTTLVTLHCEAH